MVNKSAGASRKSPMLVDNEANLCTDYAPNRFLQFQKGDIIRGPLLDFLLMLLLLR
jgi:hypothetical protein